MDCLLGGIHSQRSNREVAMRCKEKGCVRPGHADMGGYCIPHWTELKDPEPYMTAIRTDVSMLDVQGRYNVWTKLGSETEADRLNRRTPPIPMRLRKQWGI